MGEWAIGFFQTEVGDFFVWIGHSFIQIDVKRSTLRNHVIELEIVFLRSINLSVAKRLLETQFCDEFT